MTKALPPLMRVERLIKAGSLHAAGALPEHGYQTFPIPVPGPYGLRAAFLYSVAETTEPPSGLLVRAPSYIGFVDAETARFVELRVFQASEIGLAHLEGQLLGRCPGDAEWASAEMLDKEARLYRAYDAVLASFAAGLVALPNEARRSAMELSTLLAELIEVPLAPFYRGVGRAFFAWLDRVAPAR